MARDMMPWWKDCKVISVLFAKRLKACGSLSENTLSQGFANCFTIGSTLVLKSEEALSKPRFQALQLQVHIVSALGVA
tara:strand:- start:379 stop:612 length:234 start_codon:yes stop_codon:yes gene_type:complete